MSVLNTMKRILMQTLSQPNSVIALPETVEQLVSSAIALGDIYSAAAVYGVADQDQRNQLEHILCDKRRDVLKLGRWEHTPADVLQLFSQIEDKVVRIRLEKNPSTQTLTLNGLYKGEHNSSLISLIAKHHNASPEVLLKIADEENELEILRSLCLNPNSDEPVLLLVNQRFSSDFHGELSSHPATPAELLEVLYNSDDPYVRAAVVKHEHCPVNILKLAAADNDVIIRRHLASNKNLPAVYVQQLITNQDSSVRRATVTNMGVPVNMAITLVNDEESLVRRALAAREDLTSEVLVQLAHDDDHWVRQWAARNPNMPEDELERLSDDSNFEVRRAVARNTNASEQLLIKLSTDIHHWVRAAVAFHPKAGTDLLQKLSQEEDVDVLSGVASHPNTHPETIKLLSESINDDIRRAVILNPASSRELLIPLLEDPYYLHRLLLTRNKVLSNEDKWVLHDDPDPSVRFSAFSWFAKKLLHK